MKQVLLIFGVFILWLHSFAFADQLVIISPHWEGIRYEFENGFERWRKSKGLSEVKIIWRDIGGTSEIVRFVQSEFQSKDSSNPKIKDGIGIDLVFGGGIDPYETFKKSGLLSKIDLDPEILAKLASNISGVPLYDQQGYWYAPTVSAFGIFCNQKVLHSLGLKTPLSWEDLLSDKFSSWITSADPRRSGSAHMFYEIIIQAYGWEKGWQVISGLARNYRTFLASSGQAILDVVNGEVACSFAIDSQANAQIARYQHEQFSFSVPRLHSLYNGDAMAVLRAAPNFEAAKSFVEYSLSSQAQKLLYLEKGELEGPIQYTLNRLPVLPELYVDPRIKNLSPFLSEQEAGLKFQSQLSSERWEAINDLLGIFIIEAKDSGSLAKAECQSQFVNEKEFKDLLEKKIWDSQIERNKIISKWRDRAAQCLDQNTIDPMAIPFIFLLSICLLMFIKKYI